MGVKMKDIPVEHLQWLSDNDKMSRSVRAYWTDRKASSPAPLQKRGELNCSKPYTKKRNLRFASIAVRQGRNL